MSRFSFEMPRAFAPDACDAIIGLGDEAAGEGAPVWTDLGYGVDASARNAETVLRHRTAETAWLFDRLDALFAEAAGRLGIPVGPVTEPVQILRYGAGGHFQLWHTDCGFDLIETRRISVSVELSEPGDYEGGLLEIVPDRMGGPRRLPRGGATFFPSRALHHVTPVTQGVRRALVAWTG